MLSLALFPVVGMVDTFFVGRMGSALSLAGQGAANAAFNFCFFVLAVVPTLTAPRVARASARGDDEAVRTTARESLWIAGAVGLCGTIALVGWPRYFLKLVLPANAPALAPAARYLRYRALGYLPALLSSTCFAAFRGLLDTATPLRISLFYNALNAVLDPILIFGCGLGVAGAALATLLEAGLGFTADFDKPSGFVGMEPTLAQKADGPPRRRLVQVLLGDPEPLMYHGEVVYRDGEIVGDVRAASYGHTLGGAVGLAMVEGAARQPLTAEWVRTGAWEVDVAGVRYPARASLRPLYDPRNEKIRL